MYDNKKDQRQGRKTRDDIHLVRACEHYMLGGTCGDCGADIQGVRAKIRVEKRTRLGKTGFLLQIVWNENSNRPRICG